MNKVNFDLKDKVALVTGASRGIGEAIAITLADYGAKVILVSRKLDALQVVEKKITGRGSAQKRGLPRPFCACLRVF